MALPSTFKKTTAALRSICRVFQKRKKPAATRGRIEAVPPEIWSLIASHLPSSTAASLTISCRLLFDSLGNAHLRALHDPMNIGEKMDFLKHLDATLPDHWLCFTCGRYRLRASTQPKRCLHVSTCVLLTAAQAYTYRDLHLAARAHRLSGAYGVSPRPWTSYSQGWRLCIYTGFVQGRLLMYMRGEKDLRSLDHERNFRELFSTSSQNVSSSPAMPHCFHFAPEVVSRCRHALTHADKKDVERACRKCRTCASLWGCHTCASEYHVRITSVRQHAKRLVVSRFSDFGTVSDPWHPDWFSHTAAARPQKSGIYHREGRETIRKRWFSYYATTIDGNYWIPMVLPVPQLVLLPA